MKEINSWHNRRFRIVVYLAVFLLSVLLMAASKKLGENLARGGRNSWSTEDANQYAEILVQFGSLTGFLSGAGLVLESSKLEADENKTEEDNNERH